MIPGKDVEFLMINTVLSLFIYFTNYLCSDTGNYPNMKKSVNAAKCQSIYINLIESIMKRGLNIGPSNYIRALHQTARCDEFDREGAVQARRKDYADYLDDDRYQRIVRGGKLSDADADAAADVFFHYKTDDTRVLNTVLHWPNYLYHHIVTEGERTVVFGALAGIPFWISNNIYPYRSWVKDIFKRIISRI